MTPSKEELEKAAELGYTPQNCFLVPFLNGVDFGRQSSHTPAVSVEGLGDAYLDTLGYHESWTELDVSEAYAAGFQARSPLVEESRAFYRAELFTSILACLEENSVDETLDWIRSRGAFEIERLPEKFKPQPSKETP